MEKNAKNKKNILLLGGEGFIGLNLQEYLGNYYNCFSVDLKKTFFGGKKRGKFLKANPYEKKLRDNYDAIIHLVNNPAKLEDFPQQEKKLISNINLNEKNHLIILSSAVVYANPGSDYGKRKMMLEKIYRDYCAKNNVKLTIVRLFNIYGPYQLPNRQGSLVANILTNHLRGESIGINDLSAKRDFIFSGDVGKFVRYIIENSILGTVDLATNHSISIKKLIGIMEKCIGKKIKITDEQGKDNVICPKANNKMLKKIKATSLEKGLKKTFKFYKDNLIKIEGMEKQHE